MFDVFFALDRRPNIFMALGKDQSFQAISLGETIGHALPMFPNAARKIAGDADVQRAIRPIGDDVNPSALHREIVDMRERRSQ